MWAMPDRPGGSSAAPALYQTAWWTSGARRLGMTTTCNPLSRTKLRDPKVCPGSDRGEVPASAAAADIARKAKTAAAAPVPDMRILSRGERALRRPA